MSDTTKFKVTLEFEIDVNPISVPDVDTFSLLGKPGAKGKAKPRAIVSIILTARQSRRASSNPRNPAKRPTCGAML